MQKLIAFIKRPYAEKGLIVGTFDSLLKLVALFVWCYLTVVLGMLLYLQFTKLIKKMGKKLHNSVKRGIMKSKSR